MPQNNKNSKPSYMNFHRHFIFNVLCLFVTILIIMGLSFFFKQTGVNSIFHHCFIKIAIADDELTKFNENFIRKGEKVMGITIESTSFKEGGMIPSKYTCDGADISPPLSWSGIPDGTNSIAIISDDPDAPMGTWVHWVLYDLPANITNLPENVPTKEILDNKGKQGTNDFGRIGYGGPCPPGGTHRYYFKIYALDKELNLKPGATKAQLLKAMGGNILTEGQIMGKYSRSR